jgi:hypothetical protein
VYATEWYSRYRRSSCVLGHFMFNEWKEETPKTWVCFIFSGRPWLLMWNSNKSNIYSEDLPIAMTNRMCFPWLLMWNSNKSNIYNEDLPIVMTNRMCFPHKPDDYVGYLILRKPHYSRGTKRTAVLISPVLHRRSATTTIVTIHHQIIIIFWIG